jgi:hypothetical protein
MTAPVSNGGEAWRLLARLALATAMLLATAGPPVAGAQDTTASTRTYLLEVRIGEASGVGAHSTTLVGKDAGAVGLTFAFEASRRSWGWVSFDFRPMTAPYDYFSSPSPVPPSIGMYSIMAGVSRKFGRPIGRSRWQPLELGVGAGASRVEMIAYGPVGPQDYPADAQLERLAVGLVSAVRWQPAAAARLHLTLPLGSAFRIGGGVSLVATHVGDVRLWDGLWEPTGVGSRYRPTTRVWAFGTTVTAPVTVSLALKL